MFAIFLSFLIQENQTGDAELMSELVSSTTLSSEAKMQKILIDHTKSTTVRIVAFRKINCMLYLM
jgi:hypothetical protein